MLAGQSGLERDADVVVVDQQVRLRARPEVVVDDRPEFSRGRLVAGHGLPAGGVGVRLDHLPGDVSRGRARASDGNGIGKSVSSVVVRVTDTLFPPTAQGPL